MNIEDKDKLGSLFQKMNLDEPSVNFEDQLMQHIHTVATKQKRKRAKVNGLKTIFVIIGGFAAMVGIPVLVSRLAGWSLKFDIQQTVDSISFEMVNLKIDPFILSISSVVLFLLIADTLIRKRIWEKRNKN